MEPARLNLKITTPEPASPQPRARHGAFKSGIAPLLLALLLLKLFPPPARAQEALKMSLASAEAAAARRQAAATVGYYNLQLGQTYWRFAGSVGADYESNVNLNPTQPEEDYILRPEIDVNLLVPVSDKNSLNVAVGAGYSAYVMHSELRRYYITPNTEVSFDVYAGDVWINLHDRISVSQNSYQDPSVAGSGNYAQLQNTAGIGAVWDLNKLVLRLGYDHAIYSALSGGSTGGGGNSDGESDLLSASAGCLIGSGMQLGLELGGGISSYGTGSTNSSFGNATEWNAGAYCEMQATKYIHLRASAGYTQYLPEARVLSVGGQNYNGIYTTVDLSHRLNQYVDYNLGVGHTINFAFFGGTVDLYYARWSATWKIFQKTSLSTSFDYEHGSQIGTGGETFDRYGPAIHLGRAITERLDGSLGGQFFWRYSDVAGRDYTAYIISSNLRYRF